MKEYCKEKKEDSEKLELKQQISDLLDKVGNTTTTSNSNNTTNTNTIGTQNNIVINDFGNENQ